MEKKYIKSLPEYEKIEFDNDAVLNGRKVGRKMPTNISLPPEVVEELKKVAIKKGIPYQVLMRIFIMEGLEKIKKIHDQSKIIRKLWWCKFLPEQRLYQERCSGGVQLLF